MAYAGIFCLLQNYRMQKADSDYKLISLSNEKLNATRDLSALEDVISDTKSRIKSEYYDYLNAFEADENGNVVFKGVDGNNPFEQQYVANKSWQTVDGLDDKFYERLLDEVDQEFSAQLRELQEEEEEFDSEMDQEETVNAELQANIESYQAMLQANIEQSHTYGYQN